MRAAVKLPKIGMTMEEATIVKFCKQPGETFREGEPIFEIETEKVNHEVVASADGVMLEHCVVQGNDVAVGTPVCVVDVSRAGQA